MKPLTLLSAAAAGYHSGVAETSRNPVMVGMALAFAAVIMTIVDMDLPSQGFINVSQEPMVELRASLSESKP